jgi:hypothetical protein
MSTIQRIVMAICPKGLADSIRDESNRWQIRCDKCGNAQSYWDVGGIRWKSASKSKRILIRCRKCDRIHMAAVERI